MADSDTRYIDPDIIANLVYNEKKYIKEFAHATEESFKEFNSNYQAYLLDRDETNFRKTGHKIKPVALMLNIDVIVEEYEHAKQLLWDEAPEKELQKSADKVETICEQILEELETLQEEL